MKDMTQGALSSATEVGSWVLKSAVVERMVPFVFSLHDGWKTNSNDDVDNHFIFITWDPRWGGIESETGFHQKGKKWSSSLGGKKEDIGNNCGWEIVTKAAKSSKKKKRKLVANSHNEICGTLAGLDLHIEQHHNKFSLPEVRLKYHSKWYKRNYH